MDRRLQGFTTIELLVSATLLVIIIGIVLQITDQTSQIWRSSNARIQAFQEARSGFESMSRKLSQATLNTYYDYYDANFRNRASLTSTADLASFVPTSYDRASDLHFICGAARTLLPDIITQTQAVFFQAPLGYSAREDETDPYYPRLANGLNASGYYLQFDHAINATQPAYVKEDWPGYNKRYRFRLMELIQPTEELRVYQAGAVTDWFTQILANDSRILAENVIALALLPKLSDREDDPNNTTSHGVAIAPNFNYNSRVGVNKADTLAGFPHDRYTAYPPAGSPETEIHSSRHHQLPPLMRVVMIVIDEASAARLQGTSTTVPAAIDFDAKGLFTDAADLDADIAEVEKICNAAPGNLTGNTVPLTYRVFSTDLIMREAKWSKDNYVP